MRWLRRSADQGRDADPDQARVGEPMADARRRMVRDQIEARGLRDPELLRAFAVVPRHRFVDSPDPYGDQALPIRDGQTISQPYVVATMTDAARPPGGWQGARVLEIGTGSGYQAAVLAELGADLTTVERYPQLSRRAGERLREAGYDDVQLVVGDGTQGYPEGAPYDVVLVTAAGPSVPKPLLQQLKPDGGRLVMPVGSRTHQWLTVVLRQGDEFVARQREPVVFVPLIGEHGFEE